MRNFEDKETLMPCVRPIPCNVRMLWNLEYCFTLLIVDVQLNGSVLRSVICSVILMSVYFHNFLI